MKGMDDRFTHIPYQQNHSFKPYTTALGFTTRNMMSSFRKCC